MKKRALRKDFYMEIKKSLNRFISIFLIVALGVAFYSGIQSAAPDMRYSGDEYFDQHRLMDLKVMGTMGLTDQDVEAIAGVKGVEKAEPGYMADVLCGDEAEQRVLHLESISPTLNQLTAQEGRLPEKSGELFVDIEFLDKSGYSIGDEIIFRTEDGEDSILGRMTYTIVGAGSSPLYISFNRGNTTVGNGEISGAGYILPEDFDSEVYTQIYMEVRGARDLTMYTDAYDYLIQTVMDRVEAIAGERCQIRYAEVVKEAAEKIAEAESELADGQREAESELADAAQELADGEKEFKDGLRELDAAKKELTDGESALAEGRETIDEKEKELADGKAQLADGWAQLASGKSELAEKEKEFNKKYKSGMAEITAGEAALKTAKEELEAGQAEYDEGLAQYTAGKQQYTAGEAAYAQGLAEYEQNLAQWPLQKAQLEAQRAALEQNVTDLTAGISQAEGQKSQLQSQREQMQPAIDAAQASADAANSKRDGLGSELAGLQGELALLEGEASSLQTQREAAGTALEQLQAELAGLEAADPRDEDAIAQVKSSIDAKNSEIAGLDSSISAKNAEISQKQGEISAKQGELDASAAEAESAANALAEQQGAAAVLDGQIQAVTDTISELNGNLQSAQAGIAQIDAGIQEAESGLEEAAVTLPATRAQLDASKEELEASQAQLEEAAAKLKEGAAQIEANEKKLASGRKQLASGRAQIAAAKNTIAQNEQKLVQSQAQLTDGETQLEEARQELEDGRQELADGRRELADGEKELRDGERELIKGKAEYRDGLSDVGEELRDAGEEIEDAKKEVAELKMPEWMVTDRSSLPENIGYGENADRIRNIGQVFPVLFFLVAALISLTTMTRMVEEERTQIGTLKALGYGKMAIAAKYLFYAFFATLSGGIAGVLLGEKLLPFIIVTAYQIMYQHLTNVVLPYNMKYALIAMGASLFCTIAATLAACYKELASAPAVLMRPPAPKEGKRVLLERIPFLWRHLSFTWKSTVRNLFRYKKRFFMTIFGIGGCMALMLVGYGLRDSISNIATLQFKNLQLYNGMVIFDEDASGEEKAALSDAFSQDERLDNYTEMLMEKVEVRNGKKMWDIYLMVPENVQEAKDFFVFRDRVSGEVYELSEEGAIITEKIASLLEVTAGDTITVEDSDLGNVEIPIAAVTENYLYHYLYITPGLYEKCFGQVPEYNQITFRIGDDAGDVTAVGEAYLKYDAALSVTYSSTIMSQLEDMLSTLDSVIIVLIVSAGLLAFVVLYNLSNININERKRELATIKVLGFYDGEVDAYVYRENILITIIGIALGVVLGIVLHRFVITTVEVDATMFGRNINLPSFVISSAFTVLFSVIVNVVMHFKLKKIDMVESLKSVE